MTQPGEQLAREFLAAEFEAVGDSLNAGRVRHGHYVCEEVDIAIRAISRALSTERAAEGWQDIESAPRDGTRFDLWQSGRREANVFWSHVEEGWCAGGFYAEDDPTPLASYPAPTHWMPIPKGPDGGAG